MGYNSPQIDPSNVTLSDYSSYDPKIKRNVVTSCNYSSKHSISLLLISLTFFLLFQTPSLRNLPLSTVMLSSKSVSDNDINSAVEKLRQSVTFLPLKDLRFSKTALLGHTWFMSSLNDTHVKDEVKFQKFPSNASNGRILCMKGRDIHDGSSNYYALAWPETLPYNATLMKGLTFVSYNHYDYGNIWHGLTAVFPLVAWHIKNNHGNKVPSRWVLYHWGELRTQMALWLSLLLEGTFDGPLNLERYESIEENTPVCFEEAVVTRHSDGGMSRQRRMEAYDFMRCKARAFCNVTSDIGQKLNKIGVTLFLRTGTRSFKNNSIVADIFKRECDKFKGCRLRVAHSNNLTFCDQVELMSTTDILISPHGAQLTNMFLMERNSSVMEFFPKGWLKLAGVGQFVYRSLTSWSGMKHQGAYRDPNGDYCPYPDDDRRCMTIFKNGTIGHNETYFRNWLGNVLDEVKIRKMEEAANNVGRKSSPMSSCG